MNHKVPIEDASLRLKEIIDSLDPSDEITIVADGEAIATLKRQPRKSWPCQPGTAKATSLWTASDFDAPLDDFEEYMC